jgi:hypothetical protein
MAQRCRRSPFQTGFSWRGAPVNTFQGPYPGRQLWPDHLVRQSIRHAGLFPASTPTGAGWLIGARLSALWRSGAHASICWVVAGAGRVGSRRIGVRHRFFDIDEYGEGLLHFESGVAATLGALADLANPVTTEISGTAGHAVVINKELFFRSQHITGATGTAAWTALPLAQPAGFDLYLDWLQGSASTQNFVSAAECAERDMVMEMMYAAA